MPSSRSDAPNQWANGYTATPHINEITVWAWIAYVVVVILLLGTALSPGPQRLASNDGVAHDQLLVPPIRQLGVPAETVPNL